MIETTLHRIGITKDGTKRDHVVVIKRDEKTGNYVYLGTLTGKLRQGVLKVENALKFTRRGARFIAGRDGFLGVERIA